jgi:hypothetical protein
MALVIVASTLPMAVLCTSTPVPGFHPDYSVEIVGERDPTAISGTGITYDVDDAAFGEWIALNVDLTPHVRIVTQQEVDDLADQSQQYGFELGLETPPEGGGMFDALSLAETQAALQAGAQRRRQAEMALRQAEQMRKEAEIMAEAAAADRDVAETFQRDAMAALAAKEAATSPPPPSPPAPQRQS